MTLQKGNSEWQQHLGCSAFEGLASVANERPARVGSSIGMSALHCCIMAQESRESCHGIWFQLLSNVKNVAGNYKRAKAPVWQGGEIELQTMWKIHQKNKNKKFYLAKTLLFIGPKRKLQHRVLFFLVLTIHFYQIVIMIEYNNLKIKNLCYV
jgi:hypothetical protein